MEFIVFGTAFDFDGIRKPIPVLKYVNALPGAPLMQHPTQNMAFIFSYAQES